MITSAHQYEVTRSRVSGMRNALAELQGAPLADLLQPEMRELQLDALRGTLHELDAELARNAGDLAQAHQLRGYDAVHLAAAMAALDAELVLVTGDNDLAGAARSLGLPVALTR